MAGIELVVASFVGLAAALAALIAVRRDLTRARGGKILAFMALFLLPALSITGGFSQHMDKAQTTEFCVSCHTMSDHGRTLLIDDPSYLPAVHFQNNLVPRDRACYTCHTDYAMFGGVRAKLRGMRHLYVQYLGNIPPPDRLRLYEPYNNRECLHCHDGARRFETFSAHTKTPQMLGELKSNTLSCTSSRCHDIVHDVSSLPDVTFWKGGN